MDATSWLFLAFLAISGVIIIIALILNPSLRARIRIGPAEMNIDTARPGWKLEKPGKSAANEAMHSQAAASPRCHAWLVAKAPGKSDWRYCLDGIAQVYIGRHVANQIVLRDQTADSQHAVIFLKDGRYRIHNLSQRGTLVNEQSISWKQLGNGNKIRMGRTELIFRQDALKSGPDSGAGVGK